ncbi:DUF1772 domain-containing protein [Polymorphospora rubra]|uniref:Membrane protein n=1 Tax=Polymorphospora rubra TaxID=338584 RepID=A0A810NBM5_9ACTN|nr:anthrone oxygenase family protein [Polymorphospora rubra]BCJ69774.1 membrane protein [Polymorphospora rubra]
MGTLRTAVLVAATGTAGLLAGLFYAYACSVMPGLRRTDDRTFVEAMRHINVAILNGWFALSFGGAPLLALVAVVLHWGAGGPTLWWTVAAVACHAVTLGVTGAVNVPLNNRLDAAGGPADPGPVRAAFEARWVRWNLVRTVASVAAFGCLLGALLHG